MRYLRDILENEYFRFNLRIRCEHTRLQYRIALEMFRQSLGREPTLDDLTDDNIRATMLHILSIGRGLVTANDRRIQICALWKWCSRRGYLAMWPTVESLPVPQRIPRAWTEQQLRDFIESCKYARGKIGGIPAPLWWMAFTGTQWDTSERTGAMLALRWEWYSVDTGVMFVPAEVRKGKRKDALYTLMPDTMAALARLRIGASSLIFPGIGSWAAFYKRYSVILRRAGLPTDRSCKPQKMRRSHASHLKAAGGDATASLMHESDSTTRRAYLDPSICDSPPAARLFRILPPIPE